MKRVALLSAALLLSVTASFGSGVLVEAESFGDKGGWAVDQQFMDQMGSPYLIAHGMGKPVADAVTTVEFPETGTYQVYVRTFNWVAPWYDGEGPGKFTLRVGSRKLPATLGCVLGALSPAPEVRKWLPTGAPYRRAFKLHERFVF